MNIKVSASEFSNELSHYVEAAEREPVSILDRDDRRRVVVVSAEFFDRAVQALEDVEDSRSANAARRERAEVSHEQLKRKLNLL